MNIGKDYKCRQACKPARGRDRIRWTYEYDVEADAISVQKRRHRPVRTVEAVDDLLFDFTKDGNVTAVELLSASHHINCGIERLVNPHSVYACLGDDCFTLRLDNRPECTYKTRVDGDLFAWMTRKLLLRIYPCRQYY